MIDETTRGSGSSTADVEKERTKEKKEEKKEGREGGGGVGGLVFHIGWLHDIVQQVPNT